MFYSEIWLYLYLELLQYFCYIGENMVTASIGICSNCKSSRIVDPHWLPISKSRDLMTKNWKKFAAVKLFYILFGSKIAIYLSLGLHKGHTIYRRSIQPSKENIQHFKTWKFFTFFYICGQFFSSRIRIQQPWNHDTHVCRWATKACRRWRGRAGRRRAGPTRVHAPRSWRTGWAASGTWRGSPMRRDTGTEPGTPISGILVPFDVCT